MFPSSFKNNKERRAYITKHSVGSKPEGKAAVICTDGVLDHRMEDRLGLLNATIKLKRKLSRQERLKERAEKEQAEIRQEAWDRVRKVDKQLLKAGITLKNIYSIKGKKEPEEQKKEKTAIQDRSLDEWLLQATAKLKVKHHRQEITPHVRDKGNGSNEEGDETAKEDNHSSLDNRLLNPAIKLKDKHSSKQYRTVNRKQKNKIRILHPTTKVEEHIIILSGSSASFDSPHVYYENYHGGSSPAPISVAGRSVHTDVAQASSRDTSLEKPFQKREMRLRELEGDDSNTCLAVGPDGKIPYSSNTYVQTSTVASTQTDFDLPMIDETEPKQILEIQTKSPMVGLLGMFWGCTSMQDAQLDSDKKLQDKYSAVQVNEDIMDYVFNDVEGFASNKKEEDHPDTRILPKPAFKYEKDELDKVSEPMESRVCRGGSNEVDVNSTKDTQEGTRYNQRTPKTQMGKSISDEGLFGYVFNDVESLVCHQSKYATHEVDHSYEKDVFDKVFEPLESMICQHDVPGARRRAVSDQNEHIRNRLHDSAIKSAAFREAEARTAGIQSTRDTGGTGPIPLVLQYDERDVLDNVFESMPSFVFRNHSAKAKRQLQKRAFEPMGSAACRDDTPAVGGDWESNKRDEPIEQERDVGSRASRAANLHDNVESVSCKQDAPGFRGDSNCSIVHTSTKMQLTHRKR